MNIFVLDINHEKCVRQYVDRHVVKMIVETAQLLCTAHHVLGSNKDYMYRKTHENHPCAKWARETLSNYIWLVNLGMAMCREYTYRYDKIHKTEDILRQLQTDFPPIKSEKQELTPFALAMPDECKINPPTPNEDYPSEIDNIILSAVMSYRIYYIRDKQHLAKWTKREMPDWFVLEEKKNLEI